MSDQELREALQRVQMEQQYAKLTSTPAGKSNVEKGYQIAKKAIEVGETANKVYNLVNSPGGKAAIALIKSTAAKARSR
jgi:hypothetical protein